MFVRDGSGHDNGIKDGVAEVRVLDLLSKDICVDQQIQLVAILPRILYGATAKDSTDIQALCVQLEDFGIIVWKRNRSLLAVLDP